MRQILFLSLFCISSLQAVMGQNVVLSTLSGELYEFDRPSCTINLLGKLPTALYDISFHPDASFYGVSGTSNLLAINLQTGENTIIHQFVGQNEEFFNSMTIDFDGLLYVMGSKGTILTYDFLTQEQTELGIVPYPASGDLTFFDGELYAAIDEDRILKINEKNPENSQVVIAEDLTGEIWGIVSVDEDCGDIKTYAITNGNSGIFELDFKFRRYTPICELNIEVSGGASRFEFISSYEIRIDNEEYTQPTCEQADGRYSVIASYADQALTYTLNGSVSETGEWANLSEGSYEILITSSNFCIYKDSFDLESDRVEFFIDQIQADLCNDPAANGSFIIEITSGTPPFEIQVNEEVFLGSIVSDLYKGNYQVYVEDSLGCDNEMEVFIPSVRCPFDIPNVFSPNGDSSNDFFSITLPPGFAGKILDFHIYDRWGNQVFRDLDQSADIGEWNGKYKGIVAAQGVYSYVLQIQYLDGFVETLSGNVLLVK